MARSMTAYGRGNATTDAGLFLIEIHSVNRKSLDISISLPKELLALDMDLRKRLAQEVKRGNVSMRITKEDVKGQGMQGVAPDKEVMKQLHQDWQDCAKALGYEPQEAVPFHLVLNYALSATPSLQVELDETFRKQLFEGVEKAIEDFLHMKMKEGKALLADMKPRVEDIGKNLGAITELTKEAPKKYQEKLHKRLEELRALTEGDEERLARELVIFADKVDVTEELTRLSSHVTQFHDILVSKKRRLGRELEFLIQEMNREVNTIGAKSQDLQITQLVVAIKSELEKIREQIQNIE